MDYAARPALFQAAGAFPGISAHLLVDGILEPNKLNNLHDSRDGHPLTSADTVSGCHNRSCTDRIPDSR